MKDGDNEAWHWFVGRYDGFVRDVLRRRLPFASLDDAVLNFWTFTFEQGLVQKHQPTRRFRAFLNGCLVNYAHKVRAARTETLPLEDLDPPDQLDPTALESAEVAAWAENLLHVALETMSKNDKRRDHVDLLRRFYGLGRASSAPQPGSHLATELGITPNALYVRLNRARSALRAQFEIEVRHTLTDENDLRSELAAVLGALVDRHPGLIDG